jgi:hypothetical protein
MPIQQQVPQGTLNRLLATILPSNGAMLGLKVTSGFLGTEAIRMAFDDTATDLLPTMTGMVTSPRPYQGVTLTIAIVKTTVLAAAYMQQFLTNTFVGDLTVTSDSKWLPTFFLYNMTLETVREMSFNGTEPVIIVTMRGYRYVNDNAFDDSGLEFSNIAGQIAVPVGG